MKDTIDNKAMNGYLLRLADSSLTMGQRLAEWCGHGPYLEEDIAITNVSLDAIGHAQMFYQLAVDLSGEKQTPDDLAFLRDAHEYRNPIITELPKGDFAYTTLKQYFVDVFNLYLYQGLAESKYQPLSITAKKALMEVKYHVKRSEAWIERLALSTEEALERTQKAMDDLWFYTPELFEVDAQMQNLINDKVIPDYEEVNRLWQHRINTTLERCQINKPDSGWVATGGLEGEHSEHLGYLLAEMQFLPRAYPGSQW